MAATREKATAADVLVAAVSPMLIMSLVGSLVFFLAEVFYGGRYEGRLLYTLFFFVVGIVLVNRVAVVLDRARAWLYGGILAIVTYVALQRWVAYPEGTAMAGLAEAINLVLIVVVWWASNRLVWDCTFIDDNRTGSGKGLLAAAGWERAPGVRPDVVDDVVEDERRYPPGLQGWYARYDQWVKSRAKRPHTPGLTVAYFSLAALPIFGLGQALIPVDDEGRRAFAFRLAAVYVASGLGLLLTTSFLGLRRYLRQRNMRMPAAMTARWMGLGTVLIVVFVVVGALLPRPYSESPIWNPTRAITQDRQASRYAVNRDSGGKGDGRTGEESTKGDGNATAKGGEQGGKGQSGESKAGSGDKAGKSGSSDQKGEKGDGRRDDGSKGEAGKGAESKDGSEADAKAREARDKTEGGRKSGSSSSDRFSNSSVGQFFARIAGVLKWVVFGLVAILVVFVIARHGLQFLANFMPWARSLLNAINAWLRGLFGKKERSNAATEPATAPETVERHVPFAAFSNPFTDGSGRSIEGLVRYSYSALEAWAADRDRPRRPQETAIEFVRRLGDEFPWLEAEAVRLANLVSRLVYADGLLPANARQALEEFWGCLASGAEVVDEVPDLV